MQKWQYLIVGALVAAATTGAAGYISLPKRKRRRHRPSIPPSTHFAAKAKAKIKARAKNSRKGR